MLQMDPDFVRNQALKRELNGAWSCFLAGDPVRARQRLTNLFHDPQWAFPWEASTFLELKSLYLRCHLVSAHPCAAFADEPARDAAALQALFASREALDTLLFMSPAITQPAARWDAAFLRMLPLETSDGVIFELNMLSLFDEITTILKLRVQERFGPPEHADDPFAPTPFTFDELPASAAMATRDLAALVHRAMARYVVPPIRFAGEIVQLIALLHLEAGALDEAESWLKEALGMGADLRDYTALHGYGPFLTLCANGAFAPHLPHCAPLMRSVL